MPASTAALSTAPPGVFGWATAPQAPGNALPEWLLEKPNWGALFFGWWWTLWNADARLKWIGFAMVLPLNIMTAGLSQFGFSVYLCIYGNRIAARYRRFESVEQFRSVQRAWATWAVIILAATVALTFVAGAIAFLIGIFAATNSRS